MKKENRSLGIHAKYIGTKYYKSIKEMCWCSRIYRADMMRTENSYMEVAYSVKTNHNGFGGNLLISINSISMFFFPSSSSLVWSTSDYLLTENLQRVEKERRRKKKLKTNATFDAHRPLTIWYVSKLWAHMRCGIYCINPCTIIRYEMFENDK